MEELKQIISKESQEGENITLDEIQKLDKQKLAENLSNIDPALKQSLLSSLKRLISKEVSNGNAKNSPETVIFALQIFGKLQWFSMNIDGKYSQELNAPDFQKLFLQTKTAPTSLSEKIGLPIEKLKDAKNLWEFLNVTLETLLKKYAQKLSSPEWIPLKKEDIYKELVGLIHDIDKNLPAWNKFKGNSETIIQNFLIPKENGELLIQNVLDKIINPDRKELSKSDIDTLKITLKWWLGTLIDIAKESGSDAKLKNYINEFKNIPKVKELLLKIPEFDKVFDLFISMVKTLDKKELSGMIDTFFDKNTQNLLIVANNKPGEKIDDKVKLAIIHDAWDIVDGLITKERVTLGLNWLSQFDFLKKNPLISQILDIINNGKLSPEDKYTLFKEISLLVSMWLDPNLKWERQSENIKRSLNIIVELLSKFNKEWKIDEQKVVNLIKEFLGWSSETSLLEKIKKIKSITELWSFVGDNFHTLKTFVLSSVIWKDGFEEAIKDFIRNHRLSDNITNAGWKLMERLEKAFQLNTSDMILSLRNTLLETQIWMKTETEEKTIQQKAALDIGSMFVDKISKKWFELMKQKLTSANQNDKKLTKEDIVNTIFSGVADIFQDKELSNSLFENAKKLGAKVDNKEKFIQNMVSYFVNNSEFKAIINNISGVFINRLAKSSDVNKEIDAIKNDFKKLANDFARNYSKEWINGAIKTIQETKIVDEKTKNEMLSLGVSLVYDYISKKENIAGLLQAFPELKAKLPPWISEEKTIEIATHLLKQIPKDLVWKIVMEELGQNKKIEDITTPSNILAIANKILSSPEVDKNALLQTAIDAKLGQFIGNADTKEWAIKVDKQTLSQWIDVLYTLLWNAQESKIQQLTTSLWLDKILWVWLNQVLQNVKKEDFKQVVLANAWMISGGFDMNNWLKFASELYQKVPSEKRLQMVDVLISNLPKNWESQTAISLSAQNASYISDMLYATLETGNAQKLKEITLKLAPSLEQILSTSSLGNTDVMGTGVKVLSSIPKTQFENFLEKNSDKINTFMQTKDLSIVKTLWVELLKMVDGKVLKEHFKNAWLSKNENAWLDMMGSVQKSMEKNAEKISSLVQTWEKIVKHINTWEKDISKSGLTQEEIKIFSENMFDVVADTLNMELQNIKETQNLSSLEEAREVLASKFELPKSDWSSKIDMSKISVLDFVMNNLWFSMKWWLSMPFRGMESTIKNAWIDYFLEPWRKQDFSRIATGYFS